MKDADRRGWRRFAPRISLRVLMVLVLVAGGWLGRVVHRARLQREGVEAVKRSGGWVRYDWELTPVSVGETTEYLDIPNGKPWWPPRMVDAIGPEYFGRVVVVYPGAGSTDADMARIARMPKLKVIP